MGAGIRRGLWHGSASLERHSFLDSEVAGRILVDGCQNCKGMLLISLLLVGRNGRTGLVDLQIIYTRGLRFSPK